MRSLAGLLMVVVMVPVAPARAQDRVPICHATGNPENPYVALLLDSSGTLEHVNHEEDLVPAPEDGCPATTVADPQVTPAPTVRPEYAVPTPAPTLTASPTATPTRDSPRRPPRPRPRRKPRTQVLPTFTGAVAGASGPQATAAQAAGQSLPLTGGEAWLIAAAGLGLMLTGTGGRLLSRPRVPSGR